MDDGYLDGSGDDKSGHKCNGVLRGQKGTAYEGGTRVPFIAHWPGRVPAGKTSQALICSVDLLASFAALTGAPLPADAGPDSFDVSPALLAERPATPCRETLIMQGNVLAVRQGKWKLIPSYTPPNGKPRPAELFDLEADLPEANNLAEKYPDKVKELLALLDEQRKSGRSRPGAK
jgi:arylsulfatase A-like enzyme